MVLAILALIAFILLFGAGVVKGFLANAAALIGGFVVFVGLVLWIGSFFGENGPEYVIWAMLALLLALALWAAMTATPKPDPIREARERRRNARKM